jgi:hypothetical protein
MASSHARSASNDFASGVLLDPLRPRKTLDLPDGTWTPNEQLG